MYKIFRKNVISAVRGSRMFGDILLNIGGYTHEQIRGRGREDGARSLSSRQGVAGIVTLNQIMS